MVFTLLKRAVNKHSINFQIISAIGSLFISCILFASATKADDAKDVDLGLDINLGHQHQSFNHYSADLTNLTFDPNLQVGNWDFSLAVPWYQKKGEFYIDGVRPRLLSQCEKLAEYTVEEIRELIRGGTDKQRKLVTRCKILQNQMDKLSATESGIGDITGFVHYSVAIGENTGWYTSAGLGYKTDSGDEDTGLGTGSRDTQVELSVGFSGEKYSFSIMGGYDAVSGDEPIGKAYRPQNYAYTSTDFSRAFTDWLTLGVNFSAQQAYIENGDTMKVLTVYVDFIPAENWNLHVYTSDYSGVKGAPNREIGASVQYSF